MKQQIYKTEEGKKEILDYYESALRNWPVAFKRHFVNTRFGVTAVFESGGSESPVLVLLHGSCTNSLMWMPDVKIFSRYFRVFAVDIIGEPGKSAENRPSVSSAQYGDWISDILNEFQISAANFVGNSLGGWMALNFAVKYPERVLKIVLLAPSGIVPARISFLFKAMVLLCLGQWGNRQMNRIVYGNIPVPAEAIQFGDLVFRNFRPRMEPLYIFSDDELKNLTMPVFYAGGECDALLYSDKSAARLKKLLPDVKTDVMAKTGHVLINMGNDIVDFLKPSVHTES